MATHIKLSDRVRKNTDYRRVLYTSEDRSIQYVAMRLKSYETIPIEKHDDTTQTFYPMQGSIKVITFKDNKYKETITKVGEFCIVEKGTYHEVLNHSGDDTRLLTVYTPAEHPPDRRDRRQPEDDH